MNRVLIVVAVLFLALMVFSCDGENDSKPVGSLGGNCYPTGTCDIGLKCYLSLNVCLEDSSGDTGNTGDDQNQVSLCGLSAIADISALNSSWATGEDQDSFQLTINLAACTGKDEFRLVKATLDGNILTKDYDFMCGCTSSTAACTDQYATHCDLGSFYGVVFTTAAPADAKVLTLELEAYGLPVTGVLLIDPQGSNNPYFFELCEGREEADCEVCNPSCGSRECGSDGCGGQCGTCSGDQICQAGKCVDSGDDECQNCLSQCQGMPSCCTGSGCICEEECTPSCDPPNEWCCSSTGDCMCMPPDNCPY